MNLVKAPRGWVRYRINDIAKAVVDKVDSGCTEPVYAVTKYNGFVPSSEYFKKQVFSKNSKGYKRVRKGQFAYATIHLDEGSLGLLEDAESVIISPMYNVFRIDESRVWPPFLYKLLKSPSMVAQYQYLGTGSVHRRKAISFERLGNLEIILPSVEEQKHIAVILDKADEIHRKRQRSIERMEDFLRSVFLDMFFHSTATHTEYRLTDLADEARSSFVNGPFGSDLLSSELQVEGVPVIYIRDIRDGEYKRVSTSYVTAEKAEQLSFCRVDSGDVLIAKVGDPPGTAALYPDEQPPAIVTQDVIRIKVDKTKVTSEFIANYLNSVLGQQVIKPIIMEATRSRFSLGDFKNLQIPVPCLEAQVEFSRVSQKISRTKRKELAALMVSDFLFESLSHLAFRGELTRSAADEILQRAAAN